MTPLLSSWRGDLGSLRPWLGPGSSPAVFLGAQEWGGALGVSATLGIPCRNSALPLLSVEG